MKWEVDLLRYLPSFLQEIREFQVLSKAEIPEFESLNKVANTILDNNFIQTASLQGIKKWEKLLSIGVLETELDRQELDRQRATILGKWNRAIPYTLIRLYEYLDALAAQDNYVIRLSPSDYWIGLDTYDLPFYLIKAMRELVRAMIPANMIFDLTNKIPMTAAIILLHVEAGIQMHSSFYPRYNIPPHYLNGLTQLHGIYPLNGHMDGRYLDFYPAALQIEADAVQLIETSELLKTASDIQTSIQENLSFGIYAIAATDLCQEMELQILNKLDVSTAAEKQLEIEGNIAVAVVEDTPKLDILGKAEAVTAHENRIQLTGNAEIAASTTEYLMIEKNWGTLDGSKTLNGSRILDAAVYEFEI